MQERVLIKDLAAREDGPVRVAGWVEKVRDQKFVQFVVLRDESGAVQLVNGGVLREPDPDNPRSDILVPRTTTISELTHGTFVTVTGELQHNERVKLGGVEIQIDDISVVTSALPDNPVADDSGIDVRLDWRFLDLRRPEQNLIFRIQTTFLHALRQVWIDRGFIEIQTPKLMASASESRAELFEVEYFEGKAFLAQSPQFFKQMAQAAGFGGIFEVGPAFRADPSFTSRHATEFTSIDTELSWVDSHEDVMELHEELMVAGIAAVQDRHGAEIQKLFGIELEVVHHTQLLNRLVREGRLTPVKDGAGAAKRTGVPVASMTVTSARMAADRHENPASSSQKRTPGARPRQSAVNIVSGRQAAKVTRSGRAAVSAASPLLPDRAPPSISSIMSRLSRDHSVNLQCNRRNENFNLPKSP